MDCVLTQSFESAKKKDAPQIVQSFCAVQKEAILKSAVHKQKRYTGFVLSIKSVAERQKE